MTRFLWGVSAYALGDKAWFFFQQHRPTVLVVFFILMALLAIYQIVRKPVWLRG